MNSATPEQYKPYTVFGWDTQKREVKMEKITDIERLKETAGDGAEFFISLNYGLISRKFIRWNKKSKKFFVENYIDGTKQKFTEKDIFKKRLTNIGGAIKKGHFLRSDIK